MAKPVGWGKKYVFLRPEGQVRQSQIITTYGAGALIDLVDQAVLVGGLDFWSYGGAMGVPILQEPRLRDALAARFGVAPAVIVSDSFGRAWRQGTTDVALGVAGMRPLLDLRGAPDARGRPLEATEIAVADELAGAAELVMGKASGVPAALIRGYAVPPGEGSARELVMPPERDLFP